MIWRIRAAPRGPPTLPPVISRALVICREIEALRFRIPASLSAGIFRKGALGAGTDRLSKVRGPPLLRMISR